MFLRRSLMSIRRRLCPRALQKPQKSVIPTVLGPATQLRTYQQEHSGSHRQQQHTQENSRFTREQLQSFVDYYQVLGLQHRATDLDIKKAFNALTKRFHPDILGQKEVPPEQANDPNRIQFIHLNNAFQVLRNLVKRKLYDNLFSQVLQARRQLRRQMSEEDKLQKDKSALELFEKIKDATKNESTNDISCVDLFGIPPHCTSTLQLLRALGDIGLTGRVKRAKIMRKKHNMATLAAIIDFDNDRSARRFVYAAMNNQFLMGGCRVLVAGFKAPWSSNRMPPGASRVLLLEGPADAKLMSVDALLDALAAWAPRNRVGPVGKGEYEVRKHAGRDSNTRALEVEFDNWSRAAHFMDYLKKVYSEVKVSYGVDPCATGPPIKASTRQELGTPPV